jgi:Mn-dependent DtxR family transcriptional regulator
VVLEKFLTDVLDIDAETAHNDSCRLEHVVSAEVFEKIKVVNDEIDRYNYYCNHGKQIPAKIMESSIVWGKL